MTAAIARRKAIKKLEIVVIAILISIGILRIAVSQVRLKQAIHR